MKITAAKVEEIEVEISEEQVEVLMCDLLKADYEENKDIYAIDSKDLLYAIQIVYEAYSGKPIDYVDRFLN